MKIKESSSYKDRDGFVFYENGRVFRQINKSYEKDYERLMGSGLYEGLTKKEWLIPHQEIKKGLVEAEKIPFISYAYEWCFSQLKEAALLTLKIQKMAMKYEMSLKDASAYNVQFTGTRAIFIDTLSFEKYKEGEAWVAYRQFCRHFLAPLALMAMVDGRMGRMLSVYVDGIPLDLAGQLLPAGSKLNFGILSHIHLNAKSQKIKTERDKKYKLSRQMLNNLLTSLETTIRKLEVKISRTEWGDYYENTNYSKKAFADKKRLVKNFLIKTKAKTVLDLGANTGEFSVIGSELGVYTLSTDYDWVAVEKNYRKWKGEEKLLPLTLDVCNPSPAIGWANEERRSFLERGKVDVVLALALIHHLAISNNLPLHKIAKLIATMTKFLIIEFVPKNDSKVKILLSQREDIFDDYNEAEFEKMFEKYFKIVERAKVKGSKRKIYLMKRK
jgi:hypothetical protein